MAELSSEELREVAGRLFQQHATDFRDYKPSTLRRRVQRRMDTTGCPDIACYLDLLDSQPQEYAALLDTLLINVTQFFREPEAWEVIQTEVLPRILAEKGKSGLIKVWSAGCATGEEAYSLAMLLAEASAGSKGDYDLKVYATDLDDKALATARRGQYSEKSVQNIPDDLKRGYFERDGLWTVNRALRKMVIFGRHNLVTDAPISRCDLIVCRNVLIYMGVNLQNQVLSKFHYSLESPGFLFLGRAEAMLSLSGLFSTVDMRARIFAKESPGGALAQSLVEQRALGAAVKAGAAEHQIIDIFNETVLRHAPVGVLAINGANTIRLMNPAAERLWGVRSKDMLGKSLLEVALPPSLQEIAQKAMQVRHSKRDLVIDEMVISTDHGRQFCVSVRVAPMFDVRGRAGGVVIIAEDITEQASLRADLQAANEQLYSTNEEIETANEELQATNEELVTTNEELQSTNEELETTNEELQSTNEELETTNDELEARTAEVDHAKSELELRNTALEVLNEALRMETAERTVAERRLKAVLETVSSGIMVFEGDEPRITLLTSAASKLMGPNWQVGKTADEALAGARILWPDGTPMSLEDAPTRRALRLGDRIDGMEMLYERSDGHRFVFLVSAAPISDEKGKAVAGVSAFVDITKRKQTEEDIQKTYAREHRIADTLQAALLSPARGHIGNLTYDVNYRAAWTEAEVGGDFYELVSAGDDRVIMVLGDVAGKGLEAAVTGSMAKNMLLGFAYEAPEPAGILHRLNDALYAHPGDVHLVTLVCLLIDFERGTVRYASAGHEPAIHLCGETGHVTMLHSTGRALGVAPDAEYKTSEFTMHSRDVLFIYTDGLSEAGPRDDMLGPEGLAEIVRQHGSDGASEIHGAVYETATRLSHDKLTDDAASILIKWDD